MKSARFQTVSSNNKSNLNRTYKHKSGSFKTINTNKNTYEKDVILFYCSVTNQLSS